MFYVLFVIDSSLSVFDHLSGRSCFDPKCFSFDRSLAISSVRTWRHGGVHEIKTEQLRTITRTTSTPLTRTLATTISTATLSNGETLERIRETIASIISRKKRIASKSKDLLCQRTGFVKVYFSCCIFALLFYVALEAMHSSVFSTLLSKKTRHNAFLASALSIDTNIVSVRKCLHLVDNYCSKRKYRTFTNSAGRMGQYQHDYVWSTIFHMHEYFHPTNYFLMNLKGLSMSSSDRTVATSSKKEKTKKQSSKVRSTSKTKKVAKTSAGNTDLSKPHINEMTGLSDFYLVIVESPSKCSTIEKILNQYVESNRLPYKYKVTSCMGHIRDLKSKLTDSKPGRKKGVKGSTKMPTTTVPETKSLFPYKIAGVDLDSGQYKPIYEINPTKRQLINDLEKIIYNHDIGKSKQRCIGVLLATDPDREGEAMAWHLADVLGLLSNKNDRTNNNILASDNGVEYRRIRFTEITPDAIVAAFTADKVTDIVANPTLTSSTKVTRSDSSIDYNLVKAQETRRVLDRLAGFTVSPVLGNKIAWGLSAGRVQSVGMALIVQRECERLKFQTAQYYNVLAQFFLPTNNGDRKQNNPHTQSITLLTAKLHMVNNTYVANSGKDFSSTAVLRPECTNKLHLKTEQEVAELIQAMKNPNVVWQVETIKSTKRSIRPPAPYKTSTMQQDVSRALNNLPVQQVMRLAQQLYEQGLISYMRTDSTELSQTAAFVSKSTVQAMYGSNVVGRDVSKNSTIKKKKRNSQEAHEAIRPAIQPSEAFFAPHEISFSSSATRMLYQMIYQRTLASVMKPLVTKQTSVTIFGTDIITSATYRFRTSGSIVLDPGYTVAFESTRRTQMDEPDPNTYANDSDDDDENSIINAAKQILPPLIEGQVCNLHNATLTKHETQPPPRYTEASLVQELEALGVGRPSTYARIVQILRDRAYVGSAATMQGSGSSVKKSSISARRSTGAGVTQSNSRGSLVPSLAAFVVCSLLEKNCQIYVDPDFTAQMEDRLDMIASGEMQDIESVKLDDGTFNSSTSSGPHVAYLDKFYGGENGLAAQIKRMDENVSSDEARRVVLPTFNKQLIESSDCSNSDNSTNSEEEIGLFIGPWGPYVQKKSQYNDSNPISVNLPGGLSTDLSTITLPLLKALLSTKEKGGKVIGIHPVDGRPIRLKTSRYGAYLQWGDDGMENTTTHTLPNSLPSSYKQKTPQKSEDKLDCTDNQNVEMALPSTFYITLEEAVAYVGLPRTVSVLNGEPIVASIGPYGPYLKHNGRYMSLRSHDIFTIDAETAEKLLTEFPSRNVRGVLCQVGMKDGNMVTVKQGRFGSYINWKNVNTKLPLAYASNPEDLPLEEAWSLIQKKHGESYSLKSQTRRKSAKNSPKNSSKNSSNDSNRVRPKRPLSAYAHFCAATRPQIAKPGQSLGESSRILAKLWTDATPDIKEPFEKLAAAGKVEYDVLKEEGDIMSSELLKPGKTKHSRKLSRTKERKSSVKLNIVKAGTKRSKSAYQFFCEMKRPDVSKQFKTLGEISKELARLWSDTTNRTLFNNLASEEKAKHG